LVHPQVAILDSKTPGGLAAMLQEVTMLPWIYLSQSSSEALKTREILLTVVGEGENHEQS
jgi:hypothetical protein